MKYLFLNCIIGLCSGVGEVNSNNMANATQAKIDPIRQRIKRMIADVAHLRDNQQNVNVREALSYLLNQTIVDIENDDISDSKEKAKALSYLLNQSKSLQQHMHNATQQLTTLNILSRSDAFGINITVNHANQKSDISQTSEEQTTVLQQILESLIRGDKYSMQYSVWTYQESKEEKVRYRMKLFNENAPESSNSTTHNTAEHESFLIIYLHDSISTYLLQINNAIVYLQAAFSLPDTHFLGIKIAMQLANNLLKIDQSDVNFHKTQYCTVLSDIHSAADKLNKQLDEVVLLTQYCLYYVLQCVVKYHFMTLFDNNKKSLHFMELNNQMTELSIPFNGIREAILLFKVVYKNKYYQIPHQL